MRLTRAEIILVTCLFLAITGGAVVKRYRDAHRLTLPPAPAKSGAHTTRTTPHPTDK